MSSTALRREESLGLALALAGHAALFAWMVWQEPAPPPPPPERMTVTISDEVGLTSAAPAPQVEAAPDKGPEIGEALPPPAPEPVQVAKPAPVLPRPVPAPAKVAAKPAAQPVKPAAKQPQTAQKQQPKTNAKPGSASFDDAFSKGIPGAKTQGKAQSAPAPFGPQQVSDLRSAIRRQIKPHWAAPQGIDAENLVTKLRIRLDPNGKLIGEPEFISQTGKSAANAPQQARHIEQAKRAVKLARFALPSEYYEHWKVLIVTFDKGLSR
jgi:type IV secretory pathway VirB10-like protein